MKEEEDLIETKRKRKSQRKGKESMKEREREGESKEDFLSCFYIDACEVKGRPPPIDFCHSRLFSVQTPPTNNCCIKTFPQKIIEVSSSFLIL